MDNKWKIFRRKETVAATHPLMELPAELPQRRPRSREPAAPGAALASRRKRRALIERLLLARFAPTTLVVDEQRQRSSTSTAAPGPTWSRAEGQPRQQHPGNGPARAGPPAGAALRQAATEKREVVRDNLRVKTNGDYSTVNFSVRRMEGPEAVRGLFLVTIRPRACPSSPPAPRQGKARKTSRPAASTSSNRNCATSRNRCKPRSRSWRPPTKNSRSTNEELQSTNEELQSANEELETSKEEMQSLNEELSTVNTELQAKVDELSRATDDMQNLLEQHRRGHDLPGRRDSTSSATRSRRKLVKLIPSDVGRRLSDLTVEPALHGLIDDCRQVLRNLARKEIEIRTGEGTWHLMRIIPYRTTENIIDGVVLTFQDIDRPKREVEAVTEFFESIVESVREPLLVLDAEFRVHFAQRGLLPPLRDQPQVA